MVERFVDRVYTYFHGLFLWALLVIGLFSAAKHGVETKCLVIDFTHNPSIYDEIKEFVSPYDVGVLVNNVGLGTVPSHFLDVVAHAPSIVTDTVRVNVLSYCKVCNLKICVEIHLKFIYDHTLFYQVGESILRLRLTIV